MGVRDGFLESASALRPLLASSGSRWDDASALDGMTIGDLAAHAARAVTSVDRYLSLPAADAEERVDAAGYFASIDGLVDGPESEMNIAIRGRSHQDAAAGPESMLAGFDHALAHLRQQLRAEPADRIVSVFEGRSMVLDDYLVTRLVEIVVHADDLVVSLGTDPVAFPSAVTDRVLACLFDIARRRSDASAILRAFTRRERDAVQALRVF